MEGIKNKNESNNELHNAIIEGNAEKVIQCLKSQTIDINRIIGKDSYLDVAIKSQNLEVIKLLLQANAVVPASLIPSFDDANKEIIKLLLAHTVDIEKTDSNGMTYLHLAVKNNFPDIVELLLSKGSNIYAKTVLKLTAMHIACQEKNITMILLNRHMNLFPVKNGEKETALHFAVNFEDLSIVKLLVQEGACINASNKFGLTALHLAILKKKLDIVQYLIKSGADVNFATNDKRVPLHMAAECGSVEMVKILLENGAIVNKKTEFGITPLHTAVFTRRKEIVELLVDAKANVNAVGNRDETPLNIAVAHECEDIVNILISHGAIVNHGDKKDMLLHMAAFNKSINLVKLLLEHNADVSVVYMNDRTALHMAAERKCPEIVEMLLMKGADVDAKTDDGFTALHISVEYNDLETCKVLLQNKANIDLEDKKGRTPLCFAAERGYVKILQQILSFKPDLQKNKLALYCAVKDNHKSHKTIILELIAHGYSMDLLKLWPEIYIDIFMLNAVRNGHTGIVEYLLKHGYNANKPLQTQAVEDINYGSLLHLAVRKRQLQNAQLLIKFGSDINIVDKSGQKPIFYAVENNCFQMTKLLLDNKAVLDDSCELLFMAARENNFRLIREILKYYKNVNIQDEFGTTALHFAAWHGNEETVQLLFENGAKCATVDQSRQVSFNSELYTKIQVIYGEEAMEEFKKNVLTTPLHIAARKNCSDIAEAILESGLSVNCRDGCGRTPLHVATLFNNIGPIHLFMEFNADLYAKDNDGYTCIDYACNNNQFIGNMHMDKVFPFVNKLIPIINTIDNCTTASELLMKYLAVAHLRNEKSCEKPSSCSKKLEDLYDNCVSEIALLNSTKIINSITLGDVLIRSIDTVTSYLKNAEFVKAFECVMDVETFPLYGIILKKKMRRAKERRLLLDEAQIYFTDILCLLEPPANRIMDFLNTRDLACIKQAYESFYSQLGYRKCKES
ncbi:hypothetical protein TSAR_000955 [Trichomalopsis sarcophagae]|uniref:Uncharacterized protein n=1 Tax=Trichomalopsis sarcophagae TaxID=543379 RepID=A0A232F6P1_9HYME|nr:hypothetical protein TSAR_000955 [Trichomalopsis sarcophagae]